jgi:hypothetical protein
MNRIALLLSLSLGLLLPAPAGQDAEPAPGPSDEQVEAAVGELDAAFKSKDTAACVAAIGTAMEVVDPRVIKSVAAGLKDKQPAVRLATFDALGRMAHEDALKELHRHYKSNRKKLRDDAPAFAALFKAIGRHGDASSIEVLADKPWDNIDAAVIKARIYGLGNIRDVAAVEELFSMMNKGKPLPGEDAPFMPDFRVALVRLTGTDQTTNKTLWQDWWRKNKKGFEIVEQPGDMPRDVRLAWNDYWGLEDEQERNDRAGG